MELFTDRHASKIRGILSCFDRVVLTGTIPGICYADGMSAYLRSNGIRIFDYAKWAEPLRNEIRANALKLAKENNLEIEYIRKSRNFRKEARIKKIIEQRGDHPGLVHIFSALEPCFSYKPWHNKKTGKTSLTYDSGKCIHYYFYFILPELGLCFLRVPTWAPFRLQFYYNGHNELAATLNKKEIGYQMLDNSFLEVNDFEQAQKFADKAHADQLNKIFDEAARQYCPVVRHFPQGCYWSLMQVEYATDIIFRRQSDLAPIYKELVRTSIHSVKPENIATFLGRKLTGNYQGEMGNNFQTRIEGTRLKHSMDKVGIKMYDKHGIILRIEITVNDVSFFKHHRRVDHRNGTWEMKLAPVKKSIYSLPALIKLMKDSNRRYLEFISAIDDPTSAIKDLEKISKRTKENDRSYRGFNLFHGDDLDLFETIFRGEFNISGFRNLYLRKLMPEKSANQISRMLKRLRKHGLIKKIGRTYKYYLTALGRRIISTALKLREMFIIPSLRGTMAAG